MLFDIEPDEYQREVANISFNLQLLKKRYQYTSYLDVSGYAF